ncbi:MAG: hypothetical protein AAB652_02015 [Patescibacteria group bacterium]
MDSRAKASIFLGCAFFFAAFGGTVVGRPYFLGFGITLFAYALIFGIWAAAWRIVAAIEEK